MVGDALDPAVLADACAGAHQVWIRAGMVGGKKSAQIENAESYVRQNAELARLVLESCDASGCRCVLFDSSEQVYGTSADRQVHVPDCEPAAPNFYGASKMIAEKMLLHWAAEKSGRSVQIFRYSRIRDAETPDVIQVMVRSCLADKPIPIVGDPEHQISFVHLEDVLGVNQKALERCPRGAVYHVSAGPPISLSGLARRIEALCGRRVGVGVIPNPDSLRFEPDVVGLESASSFAELDYEPRWSLDQIIQETIEYAQKRSA
jgi:nucleoside-diphosphate-sugar epimerase